MKHIISLLSILLLAVVFQFAMNVDTTAARPAAPERPSAPARPVEPAIPAVPATPATPAPAATPATPATAATPASAADVYDSICEKLADRPAPFKPSFCDAVVPDDGDDSDDDEGDGGDNDNGGSDDEQDGDDGDTDTGGDTGGDGQDGDDGDTGEDGGDGGDGQDGDDGDIIENKFTVYDRLNGDSRFTTLVDLVDLAGLDDELSLQTATWTVFAPTNDAFAAVGTGTLGVLAAAPTTTLADVLLYHVFVGDVAAADIPTGITPLTMVNGDTATVTKNGAIEINGVLVSEADLTADTGVVHAIDGVLLPPADPAPTVDHLLISEVLYDLAQDGSQGSEVGGDNEWVELYNPTGAPIDLEDWSIGDGISNDVISTTPVVVQPGAFLVITDDPSTANFWDLTGVAVVNLNSSISGGLSNSGDSVILYDDDGDVVDGVSYGDSDTAFAPSVSDVAPGSSIARSSLTSDTDSAADWTETTTPTPGS